MTLPIAPVRTFSSLSAGESVSFEVSITNEQVLAFAALSGDMNPLHMDDTYAKATRHGQRVVHGFLTAAYISTLIGMYLPGAHSLILDEHLTFRMPVFIGDTLTYTGAITHLSEATKTATLSIAVARKDETVLSGTIVVQVTEPKPS